MSAIRHPFARIAETSPKHADLLARAFMAAYDFDGVLACLRFAQDAMQTDVFGYLDGSLFRDEYGSYEELASDKGLFKMAREDAWDFIARTEGLRKHG